MGSFLFSTEQCIQAWLEPSNGVKKQLDITLAEASCEVIKYQNEERRLTGLTAAGRSRKATQTGSNTGSAVKPCTSLIVELAVSLKRLQWARQRDC